MVSQAIHVFYVTDQLDKRWLVVSHMHRKGVPKKTSGENIDIMMEHNPFINGLPNIENLNDADRYVRDLDWCLKKMMAFTACMSYNSFVLHYLLLLYVPCIDFRLLFFIIYTLYNVLILNVDLLQE